MENEIFNAEITRKDDVVEGQNLQPKNHTALKAALLGGLGLLAGASAEAAVLHVMDQDDSVSSPEPASEPTPEPTPEPTSAHTTAQPHQTVTHVHKHEYEINVVNNGGGNVPQPPTPTPQITVQRYSTYSDEETGEPLYDFAEIEVQYPNGVTVQGLVIDEDRDGTADKMVLDANNNSDIDPNEVVDLHQENLNIPMKNLYDIALVKEPKDFENDIETASPVEDVDVIDDDNVLDDSEENETAEYAEEVTIEPATTDANDEYLPENDPCVNDACMTETDYVADMDNGILDA